LGLAWRPFLRHRIAPQTLDGCGSDPPHALLARAHAVLAQQLGKMPGGTA